MNLRLTKSILNEWKLSLLSIGLLMLMYREGKWLMESINGVQFAVAAPRAHHATQHANIQLNATCRVSVCSGWMKSTSVVIMPVGNYESPFCKPIIYPNFQHRESYPGLVKTMDRIRPAHAELLSMCYSMCISQK